jgi:hypothetical protein
MPICKLKLCRFAVTPAHQAGVSVAKCLLNANQEEPDRILDDKRSRPDSVCWKIAAHNLGIWLGL